MSQHVRPMRSHAIWNRACILFGFGLILELGHVEAGTLLTVDFSDGQTFQTTGSFIDESVNVPRFGTARGAVDATLGMMRATDAALPPRDPSGLPYGGFLQVNTILTDTYHLQGSNTASTVIPVRLTADGTMTLPGLDAESDANGAILVLHPGNGGSGSSSVSLSSNPAEAANGYTIVQPGTYPIALTSTFDVTFFGNQPQDLTFVMSLYAVGGTSLDFFSTAQVSFDLPPGTSITSDGGFVQTASVPEPSAIVLLLSGAPMIAAGLWLCSRFSRGRPS